MASLEDGFTKGNWARAMTMEAMFGGFFDNIEESPRISRCVDALPSAFDGIEV